ncbi:hypothetical protein CEXT_63721 [Caerostris extrusa]|uniref:Uncharacterized protein n=1 Tax=Caerostris extrusa TaxID=172846 RepID=A0AAV4TVP4_CAEEX|nr:hypothetical protein CEXT_63721 [Caerostris extrusa]
MTAENVGGGTVGSQLITPLRMAKSFIFIRGARNGAEIGRMSPEFFSLFIRGEFCHEDVEILTHPVFTAGGLSAAAQDSRSVQKNCLSVRRHTCVLQPYPAIRSNLVHGWQLPDKGHRTKMMMMYYSATRRFTLPHKIAEASRKIACQCEDIHVCYNPIRQSGPIWYTDGRFPIKATGQR